MWYVRFFAAITATLFTIPAANADQLLRYMTLDPNAISRFDQAHYKGDCRVPDSNTSGYTTGLFLIELGKFNALMNERSADEQTKQDALIEQIELPAACVLRTKAERNGAILEVLTIVTKSGDKIITSFDDGVWQWQRFEEVFGFNIVSRQHPQDPTKFVLVVN